MIAPSPSSSSYNIDTKKGQKFWLLGDVYSFHIIGAETDGKYAVLEITSPSGSCPPLHSHSKETEGFYVIDGEFSFQYGDDSSNNKIAVAKPGTFLHLKKNIPHTYKNVGNSTGRLLFKILPAGFENFFAEVGVLIDNKETFSPPAIDSIDIMKIVKISDEKYGVKIITTVPDQQEKK
jgi:quercetin dioxygenase-like cupin family protein